MFQASHAQIISTGPECGITWRWPASCVRAQKGMGQASDNRNTNHIKLIIEQTTEHRAVLLAKDETGRLLPSLMHIHSLRMAILWVHPGCHSITGAIVSYVVVVSTEEVAAIRFELGMVVIECRICFLNFQVIRAFKTITGVDRAADAVSKLGHVIRATEKLMERSKEVCILNLEFPRIQA